jgi:hypothetical protein
METLKIKVRMPNLMAQTYDGNNVPTIIKCQGFMWQDCTQIYLNQYKATM